MSEPITIPPPEPDNPATRTTRTEITDAALHGGVFTTLWAARPKKWKTMLADGSVSPMWNRGIVPDDLPTWVKDQVGGTGADLQALVAILWEACCLLDFRMALMENNARAAAFNGGSYVWRQSRYVYDHQAYNGGPYNGDVEPADNPNKHAY